MTNKVMFVFILCAANPLYAMDFDSSQEAAGQASIASVVSSFLPLVDIQEKWDSSKDDFTELQQCVAELVQEVFGDQEHEVASSEGEKDHPNAFQLVQLMHAQHKVIFFLVKKVKSLELGHKELQEAVDKMLAQSLENDSQ